MSSVTIMIIGSIAAALLAAAWFVFCDEMRRDAEAEWIATDDAMHTLLANICMPGDCPCAPSEQAYEQLRKLVIHE